MNRFIKKTIIFIIPIFVLFLGLEITLRNIPNDYSYKNGYLEENAENIKALFLGSSHTYYGINPEYFSLNSFNMSQMSQSLDLDYKILEKFEGRLSNIEYIILPISYFSLFYSLSDGTEAWRIRNYSLYYNLDMPKKIENYSEVFANKGFINVTRLYRYFVQQGSEITCDELGFRLAINRENNQDLIETGRMSAERHTKEDLAQMDKNIEILKKIIALANSKNAKVILYTPPAYHTYVDNLEKKQLALTINTAEDLDDAYDNVTYLNLLEDKRFDESDFHDADHLNERGAVKLTRILEEFSLPRDEKKLSFK